MNFSTIQNSDSRIPTSARTSNALRRQGLLANRSALQTGLPQAVRDYFDGQRPDDPAVVAQWCCDTGEQAVLGQLQAEGFEGSVVVSCLDEVAWRAAECGFELRLRLRGEIDSTYAGELRDFLNKHPLKVTELSLNLSAEIKHSPLNSLIRAIDALPNLTTVEVQGPVSENVSWVLASSTACLTLSPDTRSLILDAEMLRPAKVEAYAAGAQALHDDAEMFQGAADESFLDQGDDQVSPYEMSSYVKRELLRAAGLFDEAAARRLAPAALVAFLSMEKCPDTGDPIKSEFADALARLACDFKAGPLLRAIHALAPSYVMTWREKMPDDATSILLARAGVPCHFQHCIVPELFVEGANFSQLLVASQPFSVNLIVVEDLDQDETEELLTGIALLRELHDFTFTIAPGILVDLTSVHEWPGGFSSRPNSLILNGSESDPESHETVFLAMLLHGFQPKSLSLGLTTPNGAAALLGLVTEAQGAGRLEHLSITCDMPSVPQGPSLVDVIIGLLLKPHKFSNILIQSQEVLLTSEDEIDKFKRHARANPPSVDLRMEHMSLSTGGWQCYFQENYLLSGLAAEFASRHLALPSDVGRHMVDNGGLATSDIPNLREVSRAMNRAWERLSRK